MKEPERHHDPTWPYEDVDGWEDIESAPTWECPVAFCVCHPGQQTATTPETFSILLCDERSVAMGKARCRVLAQGIVLNKHPRADATGRVTVSSRRLPEQVMVEWAPADTPLDPRYPFRKQCYVQFPSDDREEAARRRLHNLGYSAVFDLEGNIREFQRAYGGRVTGSLDDVEKKLRVVHDSGMVRPRSAPTEAQVPAGSLDESAMEDRLAVSAPGNPNVCPAVPPTRPRRCFFVIFIKVQDGMFRRAAMTWRKQVMADVGFHQGDDVFVKHEVRTETQFKEAWSRIAEVATEWQAPIHRGALFVHASFNDPVDGLEFRSALPTDDGTLNRVEIRSLQKLPWAGGNAALLVIGCNTGRVRHQWSPAGEFAASQKVRTYGEQGYAYFSSNPNKYVEHVDDDEHVYLGAYARGKNSWLIGRKTGSRITLPGERVFPRRFHR